MRQLTLTIPDDFYAKLMTFLEPNPEIIVEEKNNDSVPMWQQEMVLERIKNSKTEDYRSWEEVKKEMDKKWNYNR
jgi:phosphopantothenoylcysteine synthetase/decarboxylase